MDCISGGQAVALARTGHDHGLVALTRPKEGSMIAILLGDGVIHCSFLVHVKVINVVETSTPYDCRVKHKFDLR